MNGWKTFFIFLFVSLIFTPIGGIIYLLCRTKTVRIEGISPPRQDWNRAAKPFVDKEGRIQETNQMFKFKIAPVSIAALFFVVFVGALTKPTTTPTPVAISAQVDKCAEFRKIPHLTDCQKYGVQQTAQQSQDEATARQAARLSAVQVQMIPGTNHPAKSIVKEIETLSPEAFARKYPDLMDNLQRNIDRDWP